MAVFSWGADNSVVRLYPNEHVPDVEIPAGGSLGLPRISEPGSGQMQLTISSETLQGEQVSHEAFIVVASSRPLNFRSVASQSTAQTETTRKVADPASGFLNQLAALDLSHATISVLPFRVSKRR